MTSWIRTPIPKKKVAAEPISYFPYNQGTFLSKTKEATVVSAFYDIPSSLPISKRKEKFRQFVKEFPCNLVLFTEQRFANELASYRSELESRTKIVVLERSEWVANTRFIPVLWTQQVKQDPELRLSRTAEEFQFGYEKKEFMAKAIKMDPFKSDDFVWLSPSFVESLQYPTSLETPEIFPLSSNIPTDRLLVANPEPFRADDIASSFFKGKKRVSNELLAGSKKAWEQYSKTYDIVMNEKLKLSGFVGDDLLNLQYVIIHKPEQFSLLPETTLFPVLTTSKEV